MRNITEVDQYNTKCQKNIKQCHKRNQFFRHTSDSLDTAKKDQTDQNRDHDSDDQIQCADRLIRNQVEIDQCGIDSRCDRIDLCGITGTEYGKDTKSGKKVRQPVPVFFKTIFYIIHRSADKISLGVSFTKMYGKGNFSKFGTHAKDSRDPHPEDSTGTADGDGTRHACNVAGAYGARQCGAHRLKRRHGTIGSILFAEHASDGSFDGVGEFADLQKAGPHTEQQTHADDAHHGRDPPDKAVDRLIDGRNGFDHMFVSPVTWIFNTTEDILSYFRGGVNLFGW